MSSQNFIISAQPKQVIIPAVSNATPVVSAGIQGPAGPSVDLFRLRLKTNMVAGQVLYALPSLPPQPEVLVLVNGVATAYSLSGVNLTITGLSAGAIESTDELQIFY